MHADVQGFSEILLSNKMQTLQSKNPFPRYAMARSRHFNISPKQTVATKTALSNNVVYAAA